MKYFILLLSIFRFYAGLSQAPSHDSVTYWPLVRGLEQKMWGDFPVEYKNAQSVHQQILSSGCTRCKGRSYYIIGKFQWADGLYQAAIKNFRTSANVAKTVNDARTLADAIDLIATSYYYQGYYDSALHYYDVAERIYKDENDIDAMIIISNNISLVYHRKGDYQNAILRILETEKLKDIYKKQVAELDPFAGMNGHMIDSIYYKEEIEDIRRDLKNHLAEKDSIAIYKSYFNLSNAYDKLHYIRQSIRSQHEGNRIMSLLKIRPYYDEIAIKYRRLGDLDSCLHYHRLTALDFPKMTQLSICFTWERVGDSYFHFARYDSAILYYEKAFRLNASLNNRITVAGIHHKLADAFLSSGRLSRAKKHIDEGIPLAKQVSLSHLVRLYDIGSSVYAKLGDDKRAYQLKTVYASLKDSINKQETAMDLIKLQTQFQTAKKIREIQDLQEENLLQQARVESRNLQIIFVLVLLIVFSIVGVLYYSRYKQKKRSTETLQAQKLVIEHQNTILQRTNTEKETLLSEIHHRVKNNLQIISSLINLKSRGTSGETQDILFQLNGRILSMGLVHERLYNNNNIQSIRIDEYLVELAQTLISSMSDGEKPIQLKFDVDPVTMDVESALTFGLICNELITNSIKYAFASDQVSKEISLCVKTVDDRLKIDFADNGMPVKTNNGVPAKSFGLRFVDQLIQARLLGQWEYFLADGFRAHILVPLVRSETRPIQGVTAVL